MANRKGKILPEGSSPRMPAVHVCDVYHLTLSAAAVVVLLGTFLLGALAQYVR